MLPKINRLQNTKDIERVFGRGQGFRGDFLFLKLIKNGLITARFAFIVSRKVDKRSFRRNRVKRRLREAVGALLPQIKTGLDAVIIAQKGAENKNLQEIKQDTEKLFKRAKLI